MANTNGTTSKTVLGARRRFSAVPKTETFIIEVPNADKVAASNDIALLQERVAMLEAMLSEHGIEVPRFNEAEAIPETISVPVVGYVKGPSCPMSVTIEADTAWQVWNDASYVPSTDDEREAWEQRVAERAAKGETPEPSPFRSDGTVLHYNHEAELRVRRDLLMASIPKLQEHPEAAGILAADNGPWLEILRDLGYWAPAAEVSAEVSDDSPEATGGEVAPTGDASSPESRPAMASGQPIS